MFRAPKNSGTFKNVLTIQFSIRIDHYDGNDDVASMSLQIAFMESEFIKSQLMEGKWTRIFNFYLAYSCEDGMNFHRMD